MSCFRSFTNRITIGFRGTVAGLALAAALAAPSPAAAQLDGLTTSALGRFVEPQATLDAVAANGSLRVIVEFAAPELPDGIQSGTDEGDAFEMAGVRQMQDLILNDVLATSGVDAAQADEDADLALRRLTYSPLFALSADAALLSALAQHDAVVRIHIDHAEAPALNQSLGIIGMPRAYTLGGTGSGQVVAVLDSGSLTNHQHLSSRIVEGACYNTTNVTGGIFSRCPGGASSATTIASSNDCTSSAWFGCGHGTHVASTVAGFTSSPASGVPPHGVARDARLMPINVFSLFPRSQCGSGLPSQYTHCILAYVSDQIAALERVYSRRSARTFAAVNMSLGGGSFTSPCTTESRRNVIQRLTNAGIAVIVSAGNSGLNNAVGAPACIPEAIAIGSTTKSDLRSSFSNWGSQVQLAAPGSDILAAYISGSSTTFYRQLSGTSMAAPHVAGAFASIRDVVPSATVAQIVSALEATGTPISSAGTTVPRINVDDAIDRLRGPIIITLPTSTTLTGPASSNQGQAVTFTATVRSALTPSSGDAPELPEATVPQVREPGQQLTLTQLQAMPPSGEVVVKFREGLQVRLVDGVLTGLDAADGVALSSTLSDMGIDGSGFSRLFTLPEATLDSMRSEGQAASGRELADLNNYYTLPVPAGMTAAELSDRLNRLPSVEFAEPAPVPAPAPSDSVADSVQTITADGPNNTPNFTGQQGYVNAAPTGIGTSTLGGLAGITGTNVRVVDVEYSWQMDHEDLLLPSTRRVNVGGTPSDPFNNTDHGTAVMGQLVGIANSFGVTGIVPAAVGMVAAANTTAGYNPAQAILSSSSAINTGDIILIEQQTWACGHTTGSLYGPSEWTQSVFDAVSTATANGRVVVAAAGNGNLDLDASNCLGRFNRSVRDSGAIIVGAGSSTDRSKMSFSSYGSRVDVQGWGQNVTTTGYGNLFNGDGDIRRRYTSSFSGTSSASPIVAGAAAAIQGRLRACSRTPLTSVQMRTLLRNTGTAQGAGGQIGPLPNVPAALDSLGIRTSCTTTVVYPSGQVSFRRAGVEFARVTLNSSGVATTTTSSFPVGSHQITAHYLGSGLYRTSTSAALTHVVSSTVVRPRNDMFADRIVIPRPGTVTGTNVGATAEPGQPSMLGSTSRNTVWWAFTAPSSGRITIDTVGSSFDTMLAAYAGRSLTTLMLVAENDDFPGLGLRSQIEFEATAGTEYQIAVAGWADTSGSITLNLAFEASGPAATTTTLSGPTSGTEGSNLTFQAQVTSSGGTPTGQVSFRRNGTQIGVSTLNASGVASFSTSTLPVGSHDMSARYLGATGFTASTSSAVRVTISAIAQMVGFHGGGTLFAQTAGCGPTLGNQPHAVTARYSPSELGGLPSGLSVVWRSGSEHLALWGAMVPSSSFLGGAGRATWSRFVFYPNRPLIRVVQRQVTQPAGATLANAQEMVLRLRVQNFGSVNSCAVTIAVTLRRQ